MYVIMGFFARMLAGGCWLVESCSRDLLGWLGWLDWLVSWLVGCE